MNLKPDRIRAVKRAAKMTGPLPRPVVHPNGSVTLCLPIPARAISPNGRRGQSKAAAIRKSNLVKAHRELAKLMMREVVTGAAGPLEFAGYSLAHFFPTSAFRDDDNADGACKAYRDGISDALGVDDRRLPKVLLSTIAKDAVCPRVEVTLHPV